MAIRPGCNPGALRRWGFESLRTNTLGSANVGELGVSVKHVLRLSGFESHLPNNVDRGIRKDRLSMNKWISRSHGNIGRHFKIVPSPNWQGTELWTPRASSPSVQVRPLPGQL